MCSATTVFQPILLSYSRSKLNKYNEFDAETRPGDGKYSERMRLYEKITWIWEITYVKEYQP